MKVLKIVSGVAAIIFLVSFSVLAADFDWTQDFNIRAEADSSGFKAKLSTRFHFEDARINVVLNSVDKPADAYIILRLGEMSNKPPEYVIKEYKARKGKGWGALAKSLGIKPGSKEFHALKRGQDLYGDGPGKAKGKGKGKKRE
ncbi:MAG: hypothetical protein FJ139_04535 [Deltaproteobacteria bacterium]|nr:hypothetical protein [Deltaproteobacteria bacterium]